MIGVRIVGEKSLLHSLISVLSASALLTLIDAGRLAFLSIFQPLSGKGPHEDTDHILSLCVGNRRACPNIGEDVH
jgi:hypothetical protein